jgi:O-glycosyl hydrolase
MEINGAHALISLSLKDGNIINGGFAATNKMLWALGNYSRFIRPGYIRIELTGAGDPDTLAGSAYLSPDRSRIVAVYVNSSHQSSEIETSFPQRESKNIRTISAYITNDHMDLAKIDPNRTINIPARSIVTVVYDFADNARIH